MKIKLTYKFNPGDLANIARKISVSDMEREFQFIIDREIKDSISKGISPIKGKRNFAKYKDKDKYPAGQKQSNKPNLNLTGEMLSHYKARGLKGEIAVTIGIHGNAPKDVKVRAEANQGGTKTKNGSVAIAARPFLIQQGEEFNSKISVAIMKAFATVISKALKSMKGR